MYFDSQKKSFDPCWDTGGEVQCSVPKNYTDKKVLESMFWSGQALRRGVQSFTRRANVG